MVIFFFFFTSGITCSINSILGEDCTDVKNVMQDSLTCSTPSGTGSSLPVVVTVADQESPPNNCWSYNGTSCLFAVTICIIFWMCFVFTIRPAPYVSSITPAQGDMEGGTLVFIRGTDLGMVDDIPEVFFGEEECPDPTVYNPELV
jgi:hypothetical protein